MIYLLYIIRKWNKHKSNDNTKLTTQKQQQQQQQQESILIPYQQKQQKWKRTDEANKVKLP